MLAFLVVAMLGMSCGISYAAEDWTAYESGRDNIRLEGYHGQPGYIRFEDGDGTTLGYIWMDSDRGLVWCTPDAFSPGDPSGGAIRDNIGVRVSTAYSG